MFALNKYFDTLPNTPLGLGVRGDGSLEQALPVLLAAAAAAAAQVAMSNLRFPVSQVNSGIKREV